MTKDENELTQTPAQDVEDIPRPVVTILSNGDIQLLTDTDIGGVLRLLEIARGNILAVRLSPQSPESPGQE